MLPRLHIVTNDRLLAASEFRARATSLMDALGPAIALHLRAPRLVAVRLYELAASLAPVALRTGSLLLVNDRVDISLAVRAGAHLRSASLPVRDARRLLHRATLGYSAHALEEAALAAAEGADYVFLGTIYATSSHPGVAAAGPELIAGVARVLSIPVIAIGGLTPDRVAAVCERGAAGVAAISGIWEQPEPVAAARAYLQALGAGG
jgi:thiamine-phosphate diphosphorylase